VDRQVSGAGESEEEKDYHRLRGLQDWDL